MSHLTPSTTIKIVPVKLYALERGASEEIEFAFAAVQPDRRYMQWYFFWQAMSSAAQAELWLGSSYRATEWVADGFGRHKHDFRIHTLHLSEPRRIDEIAGGPGPGTSATMFARTAANQLVLIDLDITEPGGALMRLQRMELQGYYELGRKYRNVKGTVLTVGDPVHYMPNLLKHLPPGLDWLDD